MKKPSFYLEPLLIPDEVIECVAVQRRYFAIFHRRQIIAATNNRLIGMRRKLFGGYQPLHNVRWQDLKNTAIQRTTFGFDMVVTAFDQPDLATTQKQYRFRYSGLGKTDGQAVYRVCQAQEQAWREKRRLRELEELRAKSGGFQMAQPAAQLPPANTPQERLQRAKDMLSQGLISDSEFQSAKAQILGSL